MWANYNLLIRMDGEHVEVYPYGLMTKMLQLFSFVHVDKKLHKYAIIAHDKVTVEESTLDIYFRICHLLTALLKKRHYSLLDECGAKSLWLHAVCTNAICISGNDSQV